MRLRNTLVCAGLLLFGVVALAQEPVAKKRPAPYTSPASGREMYTAYCAACHGKDGKGDGPAAPALKVTPADLTTLAARNHNNFPNDRVYEVIKGEADLPAHGSREMPVWGPVFRALGQGRQAEVQLRIKNLTDYVRSLQAK